MLKTAKTKIFSKRSYNIFGQIFLGSICLITNNLEDAKNRKK